MTMNEKHISGAIYAETDKVELTTNLRDPSSDSPHNCKFNNNQS